jgi:hypothetical protein
VTIVDDYVAGLAGALRGPRRARADLVAEARDSLLDAAEAYQRGGLHEAEAQRRAVAEFGGYAEVVPGYQAELAVAQGRRTTLWLAGGLVALRLLVPLMWRGPLSRDGASGYLWLAAGFDYLALVGAVAALVAWLALGWGSRYVPDGARLTRIFGGSALAFLALHGLSGAAMLWGLARWSDLLSWPLAWAGLVVTNAMFCWVAVGAWRCVAVSRATRITLAHSP